MKCNLLGLIASIWFLGFSSGAIAVLEMWRGDRPVVAGFWAVMISAILGIVLLVICALGMRDKKHSKGGQ